jgi:hypothetical protein
MRRVQGKDRKRTALDHEEHKKVPTLFNIKNNVTANEHAQEKIRRMKEMSCILKNNPNETVEQVALALVAEGGSMIKKHFDS